MNLESRIDFAVRCMEREYRGSLGTVATDYLVADLRREHHRALRGRLLGAAQALLRRLVRAAGRPVATPSAATAVATPVKVQGLVLR